MNRRRSPTRMTQVRDALDAHAEREALVALGVDAAVAEHDRVDHAGAEDRHPAGPRARRAPRAVADDAQDVERHGRLGERVVAGPEPGRPAGAEHRVGELVEQALEVAIDVPSSTIRPSTWKNSNAWLASTASYRKQRPGRRARIGGRSWCMTRIWPGRVWVRSSWPSTST